MIAAKSSITVGLLFALMFGHAIAYELDDADLNAMRTAARAYADAWLTNDADSAMCVAPSVWRLSTMAAAMRIMASM